MVVNVQLLRIIQWLRDFTTESCFIMTISLVGYQKGEIRSYHFKIDGFCKSQIKKYYFIAPENSESEKKLFPNKLPHSLKVLCSLRALLIWLIISRQLKDSLSVARPARVEIASQLQDKFIYNHRVILVF